MKSLASFPLDPPRVGRPRWTMYSESTTPTFFIRSPWNIAERWKPYWKDLDMPQTWCYNTSKLPVHNNQVVCPVPRHGLSHSVDKKMSRPTWVKKPCRIEILDKPFVFTCKKKKNIFWKKYFFGSFVIWDGTICKDTFFPKMSFIFSNKQWFLPMYIMLIVNNLTWITKKCPKISSMRDTHIHKLSFHVI